MLRYPMFSTRIVILATLGLTACGVDTDLAADLQETTTARTHWDGTPEGVAILDFLNSRTTTQDILDYEVPLDRRAAGNLIAHRDGGDRLYGTSDDDRFNNLTEVDQVRWVGPKTITRILDYVVSLGIVPSDNDLLGSWDGVEFTVAEADATLDFANAATYETLDLDLDLDRRAAASIIDAQPIESIDHLAGLYYVGKSALNTLKDSASDTGVTTAMFADDLQQAIVEAYSVMGADIANMGGRSLDEALDAIDAESAWLLDDPQDDPYSYDLTTTTVYAHIDPIFVESDTIWFGAYDSTTGALIEVYSFN
jgi:hypothetical protein